ncbi:hypothetical protein [Enterobacter roggenkampii]|uniref:hypothetical protein n=1 Tax=Enterobacter roggenkampii TaxID=1812935 RepID=UPI00193CDFFA|nr:hypothetical protein [Enterobacter roggenkampii]
MSTITKEWLQQTIAEYEANRDELPFGLDTNSSIELQAFKLALASLEAEKNAEPVAKVETVGVCWYADNGVPRKPAVGTELYTAAPAPVSVPDDVSGPLAHAYKELTPTFMRNHIDVFERYGIYPDGSVGIQAMRIALDGMNRRAAMLQGADSELQRKAAIHDALCEKYGVESLADFVDWQRNHITELEAAPPAPVGPNETAVMPDYPGYVMTQRECFQAGAKRSVPGGWVAVPIEPTEDMIVNGFESEPDESFSDEKEWEEYEAMSGCQQAAHRAKLCWAAMLAAAPRPEA